MTQEELDKMPKHLEQSLQRDIDHISDSIKEMSALAEKALEDCVTAFLESDRQLAHTVILRDQYIDAKEKEIDRLCQEFLVKQLPVGGQLRFVYSSIKINLEIERVGDYAESIARHLLQIQTEPSQEIKQKISDMSRLCIDIFRNATQAFLSQNEAVANETIEEETVADNLKRTINGELVNLFREDKMGFDELDVLMTMVRRLERVSDQARNICMETLYICTGELAKHPADSFRVLFVDEHNSCRSAMAEIIAESLGVPRFVFASAGIEPSPIDSRTKAFMASKGLDLSTKAPQPIFRVPNLEHVHAIVTLDPKGRKAFPPRPRKVVFLDWTLPNPAEVDGTDEEINAAYEKAFEFLQGHIKDLVEAINQSQPQTKKEEGEQE